MSDPGEQLAARLEAFRAYLGLIARMQLDHALQAKVDVSGVVQQTLLEAHQCCRQRPEAEGNLPGLLRPLLVNNLLDEIRKARAGKRDAGRERSLEEQLAASSARLATILPADATSVRNKAIRQEDLLRMAKALETLPERQREAVELHYLRGLSLAKIAELMACTKPSVGGLLQRGLAGVRRTMGDSESST